MKTAEEEIWDNWINGNYRDAREKMVKSGVTGAMMLEYLDYIRDIKFSSEVEDLINMLDGIIAEYQDGIFTEERNQK